MWHWKSRKQKDHKQSLGAQLQLNGIRKTFTSRSIEREKKTLYALNLNWDIKLQSYSFIVCRDVYAWARDNYAINHFTLFIFFLSFSCFPDLQFPIDLSCVEKDHPFLEKDQLQALYRRLVVLNRSAAMRLDGQYNRNVNVCCKFQRYKSLFHFSGAPRLARSSVSWTDFMIDGSN